MFKIAGRPRPESRLGSIEWLIGTGALAMAVGAFGGHLLAPDRVADHYGWKRNRWYQREIGALNAGLGYGLVVYARGRDRDAFVGSWSLAALLLAVVRLWAIVSGDRRGVWNVATVVEDAALGLGGFWLLRRRTQAGH